MTDWLKLLATELGPTATSGVAENLVNYLILLTKWKRSTNLVATTTTPQELVALHIADSLALLPHLGEATRLIDVGSGAGIPGIILAIARPALSVTALEPAHKKHTFLATARRELHLDHFIPLRERDDQHLARPDFRPYDLAISRAAFPLPEWLTRGANLVHLQGRVLAMEGRDQNPLPEGAHRHPYKLSNRQRAIIEWHR
jgi:16S rRNA (guanine527-N7)-methyltransferase